MGSTVSTAPFNPMWYRDVLEMRWNILACVEALLPGLVNNGEHSAAVGSAVVLHQVGGGLGQLRPSLDRFVIPNTREISVRVRILIWIGR